MPQVGVEKDLRTVPVSAACFSAEFLSSECLDIPVGENSIPIRSAQISSDQIVLSVLSVGSRAWHAGMCMKCVDGREVVVM